MSSFWWCLLCCSLFFSFSFFLPVPLWPSVLLSLSVPLIFSYKRHICRTALSSESEQASGWCNIFSCNSSLVSSSPSAAVLHPKPNVPPSVLVFTQLGEAVTKNPGYLKLRKIRAAQNIAKTVRMCNRTTFLLLHPRFPVRNAKLSFFFFFLLKSPNFWWDLFDP